MNNTLSVIELLEGRIAPATIYAVATGNVLLRFDSATPGALENSQVVSGLGAGETLTGIDFRPASSELHAVTVATGSAANSIIRTYVIDPTSAAATLIGETAAALAGAGDLPTAFDFNPLADRMRYANSSDENARLNPNTGALAGNDTDLTPAAGTAVIAGAYDRNVANPAATTLYAIDRNTDTLAIIGGIDGSLSPNGGVVTDIGPLGFAIAGGSDGGFDIQSLTGTAYAALTDGADGLTRLYTINLSTGAATAVGLVGTGATEVRSLAIALPQVATFLNATTASYTDEDGDQVKIKVSSGTLEADDLTFAVTANGGGQLRLIDFSDDGSEFAGADLAITVKKGTNGDGLANIGFIKARDVIAGTGIDLGSVAIQGDLAQIDAGDPVSSTPGLGKISLHSFGSYRSLTEVSSNELNSDIFGSLGAVKISGDVRDASLRVTGTVDPDGRIGKITILGSLIGGNGDGSGQLSARGAMGPVSIGGDLIGGAGNESGKIVATGNIVALAIGGSVIGGTGDYDTVTEEGQISGGSGIGPIAIGGDLLGGTGDSSGAIASGGSITSIKIGGTLTGDSQGSISIFSGALGNLGRVKIGGDIRGATISAANAIESITIGGSVTGTDANSVLITARGQQTPGATGDLAIGNLSVKGRVEDARILAGWSDLLDAANGNASIGTVKVNGDWMASSLVAGVQDDDDAALDDSFGDADDLLIPLGAGDSLIARIASVTIKGRVIGTSTPTNDHFGFVAQQIGSFKSVGFVAGLGAGTDAPIELSPLTVDVTIREV